MTMRTKMAALKVTLIYQCLQDNETMECVKHPLFLFIRQNNVMSSKQNAAQ